MILNLSQSGFPEDRCLDFDFAVLDFWEWFDGKQREQKIVRDESIQPKKGQTWGPKYATLWDIFELYKATGHNTPVDVPPEWATIAADQQTLQRNLEDVRSAFADTLDDAL